MFGESQPPNFLSATISIVADARVGNCFRPTGKVDALRTLSKIQDIGKVLDKIRGRGCKCLEARRQRWISRMLEMESIRQSVRQTTQTSEVECPMCVEQEQAFRKLWSQVQDRAHPTDLSWRCETCGNENHISVD